MNKEDYLRKQMQHALSASVESTEEASEAGNLSSRRASARSRRGNTFDTINHNIHAFSRCPFVSTESERAAVRQRVTHPTGTRLGQTSKGLATCRDPDTPLIKIVLIGASNSGKTSLLMRFIEDSFHEGYQNTIGVDFKMKTLQIDNQIAKV